MTINPLVYASRKKKVLVELTKLFYEREKLNQKIKTLQNESKGLDNALIR